MRYIRRWNVCVSNPVVLQHGERLSSGCSRVRQLRAMAALRESVLVNGVSPQPSRPLQRADLDGSPPLDVERGEVSVRVRAR